MGNWYYCGIVVLLKPPINVNPLCFDYLLNARLWLYKFHNNMSLLRPEMHGLADQFFRSAIPTHLYQQLIILCPQNLQTMFVLCNSSFIKFLLSKFRLQLFYKWLPLLFVFFYFVFSLSMITAGEWLHLLQHSNAWELEEFIQLRTGPDPHYEGRYKTLHDLHCSSSSLP